jgi:hypothetical protein
MAATAEKKVKENTGDPAKEMLLRNSVDVLRAFMECSSQIQQGVLKMAQIINDPNTDQDEKMAAGDTLMEALYPRYIGEELGMDLEQYDTIQREIDSEIERELDQETDTFAARLAALMEQQKMTQQDLANLIQVGQPAISMMLARQCRPQRRTVERIAKALGVEVKDLWPT